jgi:uncharacterized protein YbjT (DUF2867 family)
MSTIFVTGATGKVGRGVVRGLLERGDSVRALVREPATAGLPAETALVQGDIRAPGPLAGNLDGIDGVFLVWPFLSADGADEVVEALARRTQRVVYLSAEAAARRPDSFWAVVERAVERFAPEWTFLRPTGFAANTLMWADQIGRSDVVRWVYGQAARSLIDERDIAAVAVRALTEAGHGGARHVLSGPRTVKQVEQVQTIGDAIGRRLRWEEISRDEVKRELTGVPDSALDTWASFVSRPEIVTTTVEEVTGRPARQFTEWARDNADRFR